MKTIEKKKNALNSKVLSSAVTCRWLIPVLSLLVIFQAVFLAKQTQNQKSKQQSAYIPLSQTEEVSGALVKLSFVPSGISLRKGEVANVDLVLVPKRRLRLDGAQLVLNFDPKIVQIAKVTTPKPFSSFSENKEKEKEGKITLTFLEEKENGVLLEKETKLLTLAIKGIGEGETEVGVNGGEQSVIIETGSSKKVLFDRSNLKLVVY